MSGQAKAAMRILGIDPGTATVGFGVLDCPPPSGLAREHFQCIAAGVIKTPKELCAGERLKMIREDLLTLIGEYKPDVAVVEAIFFFKNAKTLVPVAQARGVILEAAAASGIPVAEYTPMQVKLTVAGFGRAEKQVVQECIARLFNHSQIIRPDDAADALALAICHSRMLLPANAPSAQQATV